MKPRSSRSMSQAMWMAAAVLGPALPALALPPVPSPLANPITEQKRILGKILFFEEQLSASNTVACYTCHSFVGAGSDIRPRVRFPGADGVFNTPDDIFGSAGVVKSDANDNMVRDTVFGVGVQVTNRAANSPINAAFAPTLFWDGRALPTFIDPQTGTVAINAGGALESQCVNPPVSTVEMGHTGYDWNVISAKLTHVRPLELATNHTADITAALSGGVDYPELFRRAFGDPAITARRIAFALATYERTLIADQTPFDRFNAGVPAGQPGSLTPQQAQGFQLFQVHRCNACHSPANGGMMTDFTFRNIGLRPPAEDLGRQNVTNNPADRGRFKVPSLRNVGLKRNFMHNGQFTTIQQVIDFYARDPAAPPQNPDNRDPVMNAIVPFPPQDRAPVDDFIRNGLTDARVANRTFPFDEVALFSARGSDTTVSLGGGNAGQGGITPLAVVLAPSMIGNLDYRVGLANALGGASAQLGISTSPPVSGRINPQAFVGSVTAAGVGQGGGLATLHWPLHAGDFQPGQTIFAQWFVFDASAPGGVARSDVLRIPMFCGSYGCPSCNADVNDDGNIDQADVDYLINVISGGGNITGMDPDFNHDGNADQGDVDALITVIAGGDCP